MIEKIEKLKLNLVVMIIAQAGVIAFVYLVWGFQQSITAALIMISSSLFFGLALNSLSKDVNKSITSITRVLGEDVEESMLFGEVGIIICDENNLITWASELWTADDIVGLKITEWNQDFIEIIQNDLEEAKIEVKGRFFQVLKKEDERVYYFKDITEYEELNYLYENDKLVLGLVHLDNYDETTKYADEQVMYTIDTHIKQSLLEWAKENGIVIKRMRANRYLLVLSERSFEHVQNTNFNILSMVREKSQTYDLSITLSMVFARKSNDYLYLDNMLNKLLELAQSRGGDQVAYQEGSGEIKYFGGRTESIEKQGRVRARVMASTLNELIRESKNVIIVGHKNMDFDCLGSALGASKIASYFKEKVSIVSESGGMEEKLTYAFNQYKKVLQKSHHFINEEDALKILTDETLVILVDHHNIVQTSSPRLIESAKKIVVIDHHRRSSDFTFEPLLAYIENGASSASELVIELSIYQPQKIEFTKEEATIMMAGIVVDTLDFKTRTGIRTFEAAVVVRKAGVEMNEVHALLNDTYIEFEKKHQIVNSAIRQRNDIMIAPYKEGIATRTQMSQVADELIEIQDIEAAFVISMVNEEEVAVSARSQGEINVQTIMESLNGGGHFTAAALQRKSTVDEIYAELLTAIEDYFREDV